MLIQQVNVSIVAIVVTGITVFSILLLFMATRYRRFEKNLYVLHLRNGRIKRVSNGGHLWLLPLIDDFVVIPTVSIKSVIEAEIQLSVMEYEKLTLMLQVVWKVCDPKKAYHEMSWDPSDANSAEHLLSTCIGAYVRKHCEGVHVDCILDSRKQIAEEIMDDLKPFVNRWGIEIELLEIKQINVLMEVVN